MTPLKTTAFILAASVAAPAIASQDVSLYDVDVRAELSDFTDSNAMKYWPDIEHDLQQAIVERVELSGQDEDPRVEVEITKISVDGDTILPDSGEFNQLEGIVKIYDGDDAVTVQGKNALDADDPVSTSPLRLSAVPPSGEAPEGYVMVPPSQDDFYNAMVEAFARLVVEDIDQQ